MGMPALELGGGLAYQLYIGNMSMIYIVSKAMLSLLGKVCASKWAFITISIVVITDCSRLRVH